MEFCQMEFTNFPFKSRKIVKTFSICGKHYKEDNGKSKYRLTVQKCHYILCQIFKTLSPLVSRQPLSKSTMLNLHCSIPLHLANFKNSAKFRFQLVSTRFHLNCGQIQVVSTQIYLNQRKTGPKTCCSSNVILTSRQKFPLTKRTTFISRNFSRFDQNEELNEVEEAAA